MTNNNDLHSEDSPHGQKKISDKITENKIHQHLSDENDIISDDDIKNIRTDLVEDQVQGLSEEELKKAEKEEAQNKKDEDENDNDHSTISSYNILGP